MVFGEAIDLSGFRVNSSSRNDELIEFVASLVDGPNLNDFAVSFETRCLLEVVVV